MVISRLKTEIDMVIVSICKIKNSGDTILNYAL